MSNDRDIAWQAYKSAVQYAQSLRVLVDANVLTTHEHIQQTNVHNTYTTCRQLFTSDELIELTSSLKADAIDYADQN